MNLEEPRDVAVNTVLRQVALNVKSYNITFPRYPSLIEDKGWIHGVWYCGGFCVSTLYGQYPWSFLKRALSLFPGIDPARILHCPSGTLNGDTPGVTVDLVRDDIRKPQIIASADNLPFPDNSFDLVLSDPPYSKEDAKKYGTPPYPLKKAMAEFRRVLSPGGYFGLLHFYYPTFQRKNWKMRAMIGVCTGSNRRMRVFTVFENTKIEICPRTAAEHEEPLLIPS